MKVKDLIESIKPFPEADVLISTESFRREKVGGTACSLSDVTICSYDLVELVTSKVVPMIDDSEDD